MIRIGVVGSDNSHALAFAKLANVERVFGDDCRVVAICGSDAAQTADVARAGAIPAIVDGPAAMLDEVDVGVVVDRHGDLHAAHALPFLKRGLPTFVDKPFAIALDDCRRMLAVAQQTGAPVDSFSALRFAPDTDRLAEAAAGLGTIRAAHLTGPCDFESQYGGPFFYATHVVEMALRLIGEDVETVAAHQNGRSVVVVVRWASGAIASFSLLGDAAYHFHVSLFGSDGMAASEISGGAPAYTDALRRIVQLATTRQPSLAPDQILRPIAIVHAIQASLAAEGKEVPASIE